MYVSKYSWGLKFRYISGNIREASSLGLCSEIFPRPQVQICVRKYSWDLKFIAMSGDIRETSSSNLCPEIFLRPLFKIYVRKYSWFPSVPIHILQNITWKRPQPPYPRQHHLHSENVFLVQLYTFTFQTLRHLSRTINKGNCSLRCFLQKLYVWFKNWTEVCVWVRLNYYVVTRVAQGLLV